MKKTKKTTSESAGLQNCLTNQQEIMDKFNELSIKLQASDSGLIQKAVHNEQP